MKIPLPQKYKYKTTEIVVSLVIQISLILLFLTQDMKTINDFALTIVKIDSVEYYSSRRSESVIIHSDSINYDIKYSIYSKYTNTYNMYKLLKESKECQVWIEQEEIELKEDWPTVVGLNCANLSISPENGIELEKENKYAILGIAAIFFIIMILGTLYNVFIVNNKFVINLIERYNKKYNVESDEMNLVVQYKNNKTKTKKHNV